MARERFPRSVVAAPSLFPPFAETFDRGTEIILDEVERLARAGRRAQGA